MKRSVDSRSGFAGEEDVLLGLHLAADYTAEHEWGIAPLQNYLGIDPDAEGINKYRVTRTEDTLLFIQEENRAMLIGENPENILLRKRDIFETNLESFEKLQMDELSIETFHSKWDDEGFMIFTPTEAESSALKDIYEAFSRGNGILFLSGSPNPFARGGLTLGILDRLPENILQKLV